LSIFGRVHAARTYVGSKSSYLITMISPKCKCLTRLTAMLWSFLQTNSNKDPESSSNRHYSPWSKNLLIQPLQYGGLNAQNYEAQLTATLAKWIFKLIDPARHVFSWKALPFHFLKTHFPDFGDAIFLVDPIIIKSFDRKQNDRWLSYLQAWLQSGLQIAPPPKDYRCILKEPIWFSRFLIAEERNKHGRFFNKDIECRLLNLEISHISDLVSLYQSET
jgi:hypothetical protein